MVTKPVHPAYIFSFFMMISWLILPSCQKESTDEPVWMGYSYFPLETGNKSIYQIDSIKYSLYYPHPDTVRKQILVEVDTFIIDDEGRRNYLIREYVRDIDSIHWSFYPEVYSKLVTEKKAEETRNNITVVKMIFPVKENESWDGNSMNFLDEQMFRYVDVNKNYQLNSLSFDSTLTVIQADEQTLISEWYAIEVYAIGKGLVYRKYINTKNDAEGNIYDGVDVTVSLVSQTN